MTTDKEVPVRYVLKKVFNGGATMAHCGRCGKMLEGAINYCPMCGQKIDWGINDAPMEYYENGVI